MAEALTLEGLAARVSQLEAQLTPYTPITPLYSLDQACTLLPTTKYTLMHLLKQHRAALDEPMYRRDARRRRYRMLSHADMLLLRSHLIAYRSSLKRSRAQALAAIA